MATNQPPTPTGGSLVVNSQAQTPNQIAASRPGNLITGNNVVTPTTPTPPVSTTTVSNTGPITKAPAIQKQTEDLTNGKGLTVDANGITHAANGTIVTPPSNPGFTSEQRTDANGNTYTVQIPNKPTTPEVNPDTGVVTPIPQSYTDYNGNTVPSIGDIPAGSIPNGNGGYLTPDGNNVPAPSTDSSYQDKQLKDNFATIKANSDANLASMIDTITRQYDNLKTLQKNINASQLAGAKTGLLAGRTAQFASASYTSSINNQIQYGQQAMQSLQDKEDAAIATAKQAALDNDIKRMQQQNQIIIDTRKSILDHAQKVSDAITAATTQSQMDSEVSKLYSKGITNPADILAQLNKDGFKANGVPVTLKDINSSISNIVPPQIQDMVKTMMNNGAPADTINKVMSSSNLADAIKNAGDYLQNATGDLANYLFDVRQAEAKGLTPPSHEQWQKEQSKIKSAQSYADAYNAAAGKNAANNAANVDENGNPIPTAPVDPDSNSILAQTGLSYNAFLVATGQMSLLPRDQVTRTKASKEWQDFANKNGVDVSSFASQYGAVQKTLGFNVMRKTQANVQEQEIQGTIDNLSTVANTADLGKLNWGNVAKIWAGKEVNDPIAQQYAFHLEQLRNELVAYNLIAQGQINSDGSLKQADKTDIDKMTQVIKNGVDSKSLEGLNTAVKNSTDKMTPILQNSINASRKSVWDLFGVGNNFKAPEATISEDQAKSNLEKFVTDNPLQGDAIGKLLDTPGQNHSKVYEYVKLHPEVYGLLK